MALSRVGQLAQKWRIPKEMPESLASEVDNPDADFLVAKPDVENPDMGTQLSLLWKESDIAATNVRIYFGSTLLLCVCYLVNILSCFA